MAGHEAPPFWYCAPGWQVVALSPVSWAYGSVARLRMDRARPPAVDAPVLCIGNLTVGGSGKTPAAIAFAQAARDAGFNPGFLTRGYGGTHRKPHVVDSEADSARAVGDEPLLLSRTATTVVARNRAAGARRLLEAGVDFVVMDDGFQSRTVHYDYALVAVDARRGVGNGAILPAGPLRAPVVDQMRHADAILRVGDGNEADAVIRAAARAAKPIYRASLASTGIESLKGKRLLAFAGIGEPRKFFESLTAAGLWISATREYPDHHLYTQSDASDLLERAASDGLLPVTTEKDIVRLNHASGALDDLRRRSIAVGVSLRLDDGADMRTIIDKVVAKYREQRLRGR